MGFCYKLNSIYMSLFFCASWVKKKIEGNFFLIHKLKAAKELLNLYTKNQKNLLQTNSDSTKYVEKFNLKFKSFTFYYLHTT